MSTPTDADRAAARDLVKRWAADNWLWDAEDVAQALADARERAHEDPKVAPGWLLSAIADARGTHDCPVCNAGRPIPDDVTCPLCAGWTTI